MPLYPLRFKPKLIPKMWGGWKLRDALGKAISGDSRLIGESWELYDFPPGATGPDAIGPGDDPAGWISAVVANGPLAGQTLHGLLVERSRELLGAAAAVETPHGPQFPLLIKFLDARDDLSVQVHPPPEYAAAHADAFVKNEAWHVLHAEPGSRLLLGTKPGVTPEAFRASLSAGTTESLIQAVPVGVGETYYMPSGTLHALGGGILAYEVQTPSDTTYRVFDFNRVDPSTGRPRALHVEQAMSCIQWQLNSLSNRTPRHTGNAVLARAPQWLLMQLEFRGTDVYRLSHADVPIVMTCVSGRGVVESGSSAEPFGLGDTLLLPPSGQSRLLPGDDTRLLLATVPPGDVEHLRPR